MGLRIFLFICLVWFLHRRWSAWKTMLIMAFFAGGIDYLCSECPSCHGCDVFTRSARVSLNPVLSLHSFAQNCHKVNKHAQSILEGKWKVKIMNWKKQTNKQTNKNENEKRLQEGNSRKGQNVWSAERHLAFQTREKLRSQGVTSHKVGNVMNHLVIWKLLVMVWNLFVDWLLNTPATCRCLRDESAQTIVCAAT